jgi:DNA-binding transcriptional MerR regulator
MIPEFDKPTPDDTAIGFVQKLTELGFSLEEKQQVLANSTVLIDAQFAQEIAEKKADIEKLEEIRKKL